jgi:hypothetical protein
MRRLLLTAVYDTATTSAVAGIPAEVTIDSGALAGTTGTSTDRQSAAPRRRRSDGVANGASVGHTRFFDSANQQLLQGGANP